MGKLVLQIGPALLYYKLDQTLLQTRAASLLPIGVSFVTNWGKIYYKLGQLLQIIHANHFGKIILTNET